MELGQMCFGNPVGAYEMKPFQDALMREILSQVERVFWNRNQRRFDLHAGDTLPGLELRPYYWGDDEALAALPNFKFQEQEIRWYKHPMRGSTCTQNWSADQWVAWFDEVLAYIENFDTTEG